MSSAEIFNQKWLLGDSGYPLEPWLLTPLPNPQNDSEIRYNVLHRQLRVKVENVIGKIIFIRVCTSLILALHVVIFLFRYSEMQMAMLKVRKRIAL